MLRMNYTLCQFVSPDINLQTRSSWVCQTIASMLYPSMIMSTFVPEKEHLWHALLLLFNQKKKAVESYCLLVESYGEHAPSIRTCETWFQQFKSGDFSVKGKSVMMRNCRHYWMMTQLNPIVNKWLNSNYALIKKRPEWAKKTWQSDFVTQQCPISHIKTGERHLEIAWMGHPSTYICPKFYISQTDSAFKT